MAPPRIATLPLALTLLTSAAAASAECAWVLWSSLSETPDPRSAPQMIYEPISAQASRQECDEAVGVRARVLKKNGWKVFGWSPGAYEMVATQGTKTWRYVCLPDTVDPRGGKGK
jgi:hypothetical protein